ncbi:hypothetical protein C8R46DRAFT_1035790 [Mycena filopes]|nr:hypothetical protein C8R46DRAFT_1035790 [Mycena filopes]
MEPPDLELQDVRWRLQSSRCEITILKALRTSTNSVTATRDTSLTGRHIHPIFSQIELIPAELISEIFLYFLGFSNPLILCWVCRRWRHIGMGLVNLWTHPSFVLGPTFFPLHPTADYTGARERLHIAEMCRWLDRARRSPSISLSIVRHLSTSHRWRQLQLLERLIRPYASSFCSLELDTTQEQLAPLLDGLATFRNLTALSVHIPFLALDDWRWHQGLTGSAPHLQHIAISAEAVAQACYGSGFTTCFPWHQLTTLDMLHTPLDLNTWHDILRQCTLLSVGSFTIQSNSASIRLPPVTLFQLTSLTLRFQNEFRTRFFNTRAFDLLALPMLVALHISANLSWGDSAIFVEWTGRQHAAILKLTLEMQLTDDILFGVLRGLQNLEDLTLHLEYGTGRCSIVFQAIQEGYLQRLRTLKIFSVIDRQSVGGLAPPLLHSNAIFDLVKTAMTWAALGPQIDWEFQLFADYTILSDVRFALLAGDSKLLTYLCVPPRLSGLERYRASNTPRCFLQVWRSPV